MGWNIVITVLVLLVAVACLMMSVSLRVFFRTWRRVVLSPREFAERFFPAGQHEMVVTMLGLLAPYLPLGVARILPDDRLVDDLGLAERMSHGLDAVAFVEDLEGQYGIRFCEEDYLRLQTFRDAVDIVSEKNASQRAGAMSCPKAT